MFIRAIIAPTKVFLCSGGLELLFDKKKSHNIEIAEKESIVLKDLLQVDEVEHVERTTRTFSCGLNSVCIFYQFPNNIQLRLIFDEISFFFFMKTSWNLSVVNDRRIWELHGGIEYKVENGDTIVFISTLHGG